MNGYFGEKEPRPTEEKEKKLKIDVICDLIYDTLISQFDCEKYIEPLIVALVKRSTRQIVDALVKIKVCNAFINIGSL